MALLVVSAVRAWVGSAGWRCWRLRPSIVLLAVTLAGSGLAILPPIERPDGPLTAASVLVFGLTGAASRWRAGVLADRIGSRMLFPSSLGAAAVGLLGIAARLLSNAAGFDAGLVVAGTAVFGYGAVLNLSLLVAFARAGRGSATTASAVWNASFDIGFGVGALAVGAVASAGTGLPRIYVGCALVIVLTLPLAVRQCPDVRHSEKDIPLNGIWSAPR